MKILTVYYSRSGTTKKLAEELAEKLNSDLEEIIDQKNRNGPIRYMIAAFNALSEKTTKIQASTKNPADYDLVLIGLPIWASNMPPAIRTYIKENNDKLNKIALFATLGGSGQEETFKKITELTNKKPISTLYLTGKDLPDEKICQEKIQEFINKIN